jgi:hypothetical protein
VDGVLPAILVSREIPMDLSVKLALTGNSVMATAQPDVLHHHHQADVLLHQEDPDPDLPDAHLHQEDPDPESPDVHHHQEEDLLPDVHHHQEEDLSPDAHHHQEEDPDPPDAHHHQEDPDPALHPTPSSALSLQDLLSPQPLCSSVSPSLSLPLPTFFKLATIYTL